MASSSLSQTLLHLLLVLSAVQLGSVSAGVDKWLSPPYKWTYQFPLPIPPVKAPSKYVLSLFFSLKLNINSLTLKQNHRKPHYGKEHPLLRG